MFHVERFLNTRVSRACHHERCFRLRNSRTGVSAPHPPGGRGSLPHIGGVGHFGMLQSTKCSTWNIFSERSVPPSLPSYKPFVPDEFADRSVRATRTQAGATPVNNLWHFPLGSGGMAEVPMPAKPACHFMTLHPTCYLFGSTVYRGDPWLGCFPARPTNAPMSGSFPTFESQMAGNDSKAGNFSTFCSTGD